MVGSRLTPPSVQDGPYGYEPSSVSNFEGVAADDEVLTKEEAVRIGRQIWDASTSWLNSGKRQAWSDSLRAFQSQHPTGSKYLSREYAYRSSLFRPKTRAMVRKAEAQTAAAFFSNEDVVSIQPGDPDDPNQVASAAVMQELLQYRLTKTIPWFLTLTGARQDAEVMGICVAKAGWKYEEAYSHTEQMPQIGDSGYPELGPDGSVIYEEVDVMRRVTDEPFVDLIAVENIRVEPGADWRNVIKTSPYVVEIVPVYICDALEKMEPGPNGEPPEWFQVAESALRGAMDRDDDTTRRAREMDRVPGKSQDAWKPAPYDIAWTRHNIVRWGGQDWFYITLASSGELLTAPRPLKEVYLHGERPYVVGFVVLETHKTYPSSKVELIRDLQRAANDDWNLRFDAVKLGLNPRQFVRAGLGMDLNDLQRFAPGKVVMVNTKDPLMDQIIWDRPPPPDASSYEEQDRINLDMDELVGDFSNTSVQSSQVQQQSATGMHLMSGMASGMNEYELRVFSESFVEPLIRLLVKLEQAYETDPTILALAGKNAGLFQKFGINQITDQLLNQELTTRVNVGIGATNPSLRMNAFMGVGHALGSMFGPAAAQAADFQEVAKELFGLAGYKDGDRFMKKGFDPQVAMLQQQIQQLQQKAKAPAAADPMEIKARLQEAQIDAAAKIREIETKAATDLQIAQIEADIELRKDASENWRAQVNAEREVATMNLQGREQALADGQSGLDERQKAHDDVLMRHQEASASMQEAVAGLTQMMQALAQMHADGHATTQQQLAQMAANMSAPRRIVRGPDGKVAGVEMGGMMQ